VLSATFTGADLIDHVRTRIYYAATVGLVSVALLLVWGFVGISPFVLLPIGVLTLVALVYLLSEFDARRRGIDPVSVSEPQVDDGDGVIVGGSSRTIERPATRLIDTARAAVAFKPGGRLSADARPQSPPEYSPMGAMTVRRTQGVTCGR